MSNVFSTETLSQKDRFNYWNDVVTKHYAPCLGLTDNRNNFSATTTVHNLGVSELSSVFSDSIRYDRRATDLRAIPREDIFVSVMVSGEGYFEQNNRQVAHRSGDVLIYDSAKPYSFNYTSTYNAMLLRIPRPLVQAKVSHLDQIGGTILKSNSSYARLIKSLLNDTSILASDPELVGDNQFIVPTLDMLTTAIQRSTEGSSGFEHSSHGKLLTEIKAFIRRNITDEELTLESVASDNNISLRTLSRLFAEVGETPRQWLQTQRLCAAYDALINRKVANVTEAALTYGYKDLSHFSRSFKQRYGCSPKDLMK
ncbi:helix-turn-helix domain-containing protein [Vibrio sp.]|uniref:Helix-turn-helix domain-containing protein n=1 Tax=Vibrio viridaestus TaxID=2487322 RepID=A0A3N9U6H9_9VIBR|nr:helix-turn-helix domain-containing protein [Vibrio viridaestus]MDC0610695.1 helix-turn-helix domain-containing protein [Vibrio sp.]RQW63676.1 helix-turn-helix domain-containing protein [Vibrio viridaestus]